MPIPAISHEQRDQVFQDSEMQRHHANLDEGSVAVAPEIDFPPKNPDKRKYEILWFLR